MGKSDENNMLTFTEKNRELKVEFNQMIEAYREGLWRYCRYLTGSPWDGEDLFQETMVKAFGSIYQRWHPTNPKSYLYRIATTTWIDHCRKQKRIVGHLEEKDVEVEYNTESFDAEEAIEYLLALFNPRQIAVFLLKEVFTFTANEVAGMVKTTPGAVYATVRRMYKQLSDNPIQEKTNRFPSLDKPDNNTIIQSYLKALNEGDVDKVLELMSEQAQNEAPLGFQEFSKQEMRSGSMRYGLPGFRAEEHLLWGRNVIVVFSEAEDGTRMIHDIQYQEVENDKIVLHRSFYFCKEFIFAAAEELNVPPQLEKPVVDWRPKPKVDK
ncbi:sigma-70 family RNA polymerase sigma factor [Bacillus sp. ISL-35]|uniref:sigma-70 family RNA polymerase sigma factor n=1 Tax=Bacillus sp. ISL-35 TaxID=2819122 RepID=UPI001BEC5EC4|nr:sigma-70 family RNA polymerase sigma factor [Bacillus sp. ISL-35]MBT2703264.1 sigma-70 family RNA polymerase sigma factor [Chryseobacterium sp. ISL-80]